MPNVPHYCSIVTTARMYRRIFVNSIFMNIRLAIPNFFHSTDTLTDAAVLLSSPLRCELA
jgi:hypothetical protein